MVCIPLRSEWMESLARPPYFVSIKPFTTNYSRHGKNLQAVITGVKIFRMQRMSKTALEQGLEYDTALLRKARGLRSVRITLDVPCRTKLQCCGMIHADFVILWSSLIISARRFLNKLEIDMILPIEVPGSEIALSDSGNDSTLLVIPTTTWRMKWDNLRDTSDVQVNAETYGRKFETVWTRFALVTWNYELCASKENGDTNTTY